MLLAEIFVEQILPVTPLAKDAISVFATNISYRNDCVFTANVEPPASNQNQINLITTIRKGCKSDSGDWMWEKAVLEDRTIEDKYHTQPSIGIDREGYVHVAYNMHNMPWQYKRSTRPLDISAFVFLGQPISSEQIKDVKLRNRTNFSTMGSAEIPGNQITYPMFFNDNDGELYVTYRFATRPSKPWKERGFAGGVAKYNMSSRTWTPIGARVEKMAPSGTVQQSGAKAFIYKDGWSVYLINLAFDKENNMHAFWNWREGGAGANTTRVSHIKISNIIGDEYIGHFGRSKFPVGAGDGYAIVKPDIEYYAQKSIAINSKDDLFLVLNPVSDKRVLLGKPGREEQWSSIGDSPFGATDIVIDEKDRIWAIASGPLIITRSDKEKSWTKILVRKGWHNPTAVYAEGSIFVHMYSMNNDAFTVFRIKTDR